MHVCFIYNLLIQFAETPSNDVEDPEPELDKVEDKTSPLEDKKNDTALEAREDEEEMDLT